MLLNLEFSEWNIYYLQIKKTIKVNLEHFSDTQCQTKDKKYNKNVFKIITTRGAK